MVELVWVFFELVFIMMVIMCELFCLVEVVR